MQDPADPGNADPEKNGQDNPTDSPDADDPTPDTYIEPTAASTVLAEVLPGVAVVFGEVPAELKPDLIDFGLVPDADRKQISTVLASIGNMATVAPSLGNAFASMQGLCRLSDATQALLNAGGRLATKDGAKLGAVLLPNGGLAQARFIPVTAVNAAQLAAMLGPALAMISLQMQLSEVTSLVQTNIALTSQVLTAIRNEQWAELMGLVATVERAVDQAREVGTVPASLWDSVAGSEASLRKQLDLYRLNVGNHIRQIQQLETHGRRRYLQNNYQAIAFDANALLSSLKAWIGLQALRAAKARAAGREDADEARLVEVIARHTQTELDSARAEIVRLVSGAREKLAAAVDKAAARTLVAVTDRRIITAKTSAFLEEGDICQDIPIDRVRYVRVGAAPGKRARSVIDLILRDENIRWLFHPDIDSTQVDALAAVLAESMMIPDAERDELLRRRPVDANTKAELAGSPGD